MRTRTVRIGRAKIRAKVADTLFAKTRGLMFQKLGKNEGMLFVCEREERMTLWMLFVPIPLDMIFIAKGRVVDIAENARPWNPFKLYAPKKPARYVLEVGGGSARRNNVRVGDKTSLR